MRVNHKVICDCIRWIMFIFFSIAIGKKLISIYKYGGRVDNTKPSNIYDENETGCEENERDGEVPASKYWSDKGSSCKGSSENVDE